ncbi:transcriptional Coactivator p15-domain-containing protein, partial [Jimgerdemannia flammicorona]
SDKDSDEDYDEEPKKQKTVIKEETTKQPSDLNDDDNKGVNSEGEPYFKLSAKRRITLRKWKGVPMIDIREYYGNGNDIKPGKKGISLSLDQYQKLRELIPEIDAAIKDI